MALGGVETGSKNPIACAKTNEPIKRKTTGLAKGAKTVFTGPTPAITQSAGPKSAAMGIGIASVIQSAAVKATMAASQCASRESPSKGKKTIMRKSSGAKKSPKRRLMFSMRSSVEESRPWDCVESIDSQLHSGRVTHPPRRESFLRVGHRTTPTRNLSIIIAGLETHNGVVCSFRPGCEPGSAISQERSCAAFASFFSSLAFFKQAATN